MFGDDLPFVAASATGQPLRGWLQRAAQDEPPFAGRFVNAELETMAADAARTHALACLQARLAGHLVACYPAEVVGSYPVRYQTRDGRILVTEDPAIRMLDWLLEQQLHEHFEPNEERAHWDEEDLTLPAGPGPWGSGFVALGDAAAVDVVVSDGGLEREQRPSPRVEAWREITDASAWLNWIGRWLDLQHLTEGDRRYRFDFDDEQQFSAALAAQCSRHQQMIDKTLGVLRRWVMGSEARLFVGAHAAWDRFDEDWLARDHVAAAVDSSGVLVVQAIFDRHYG